MLCLFTAPNYFIREYIRSKWGSWDGSIMIMVYEVIFIAITILTIISCFFLTRIQNPLLLILSVILCSLLIGNLQIFLQNDEQFIGVNVPEFQLCQNSVYRLANYITLFGIPIILYIFDLQSAKINAIYFIIGSCIVVLILKFYILIRIGQREKKRRTLEILGEMPRVVFDPNFKFDNSFSNNSGYNSMNVSSINSMNRSIRKN